MSKIVMPGNKVEYTYDHHLNRKSVVQITKIGIVKRVVRDRKNLGRATEYFMVQLKGNKTLSKIHQSKLVNLTIPTP